MCESCEVDIDAYNHSLKQKTNLLYADRHPSMMRNSEMQSASVKYNGEETQNAPRDKNYERNDSLDSEEEGTQVITLIAANIFREKIANKLNTRKKTRTCLKNLKEE